MRATPSISVLGPLAVTGGAGEVAVGGALPRAFLAVLAVESPRPVGIDRLTSLLWGDDAPNGVKAALQQLATRVRRALTAAGLTDAVRSVPPGYALDVGPEVIDLRVFRSLVIAAGDAARGGAAHDAVDRYNRALACWRGGALADLGGLPLWQLLAPTLDDERWRAEEVRAQLLLDLGRFDDCADRLAPATAEAAIRERLWVLRAEALIRAGRPADALGVVRTAIRTIDTALGVPPGPELLTMEHRLAAAPTGGMIRPTIDRGQDARANQRRVVHGALAVALDKAEHAAREASRRLAHDEAVRHWQRALDLVGQVTPDDSSRRLQILLNLGEAHNTVSLDLEARAVFDEAIDLARQLDDPIALATATLGHCADRIGFVSPPEVRPMLEAALAALPDGEQRMRGRLLSRMATDRYWSGPPEVTLDLADAALAASTAAGDVEGMLLATYAQAFGCWNPRLDDRLLVECERYRSDAIAAGNRYHELLAHRWLTHVYTEFGRVEDGRRAGEVAIELADVQGLAVQQWITRTILAAQLLVAGDMDRADALVSEALAIGAVCEPVTSLDYVSLFMWTSAWLRGTLGDIVSLVEAAATTPGVDMARRLALAVAFGDLGRVDEATAILDSMDEVSADAIPRDTQWCIALAAMAEAAWRCGHQRAATIAYARLRPFAGRIAMSSVTTTGPIAHQVGIAALTVGDGPTGERFLRQAIATADDVGAPVFGARSRVALAEHLWTTGRIDEAHALAWAAQAAAVRHGLTGVERDAARLLDVVGQPLAGGD